MQGMVNKGYELFTKRCADGRKMNIEDIKKIAEDVCGPEKWPKT